VTEGEARGELGETGEVADFSWILDWRLAETEMLEEEERREGMTRSANLLSEKGILAEVVVEVVKLVKVKVMKRKIQGCAGMCRRPWDASECL
jgi:hypothetical protein